MKPYLAVTYPDGRTINSRRQPAPTAEPAPAAARHGAWVVLCHHDAARRAVLAAAKQTGLPCSYTSRAQMRENIDASERRAGIDPTPRAKLQGTREQMVAFYAAIPAEVTGVEGYEWEPLP